MHNLDKSQRYIKLFPQLTMAQNALRGLITKECGQLWRQLFWVGRPKGKEGQDIFMGQVYMVANNAISQYRTHTPFLIPS